jgi:pimeloyl-ACP methyl ester carboxylesterase
MEALEGYISTRQVLFDKEGIQPLSKEVYLKGLWRNIHYLELGAGEPLLMLHGGGSHAGEWINILKPLSERFHLFVIDRPGCGLSDYVDYRGLAFREVAVDFVGAFMDAVGLEKAWLLGQSMGGYFSICFAMQYPHRVQKLLLIGAPAGLNHRIPLLLRLLGTKGLNTVLLHTVGRPSIPGIIKLHKQLFVADISNVSEEYIRHSYYSQLLPGTLQSFTTLLENVLTLKGWKDKYYLGDQLGELHVPVKFIWGDKDAFELPDTGRQKAAAIKDCAFEVVENAGHCPWLDQPEKCVSSICSLLAA